MSKTSDIKDRLLALSGYVRAKHVARLLACHPKTVTRSKYKGMSYGAVFYCEWNNVLESLSAEARHALSLPPSATGALDQAQFIYSNCPKPVLVETKKVVQHPVLNHAESALEKAWTLLNSKPVVAPLSVSVLAHDDDVGEIVLTAPERFETVLTVDGELQIPANKSEPARALTQSCPLCTHSLFTFHDGVGICTFAAGTVAACKCLGA